MKYFRCYSMRVFCMLLPLCVSISVRAEAFSDPLAITPPTEAQCQEYTLDPAFYKKTITVQNILIATAGTVSDYTLREAAFLFDRIMNEVRQDVAQRVRDKKVLCLIVGYRDFVSDIPQFHSDKKGKELDFYNWRSRGFLEMNKNGHPTVLFSEEDVMHLEGGQQVGSILIHEFGHVIHGAGFDETLQKRLTDVYQHALDAGLWSDGFAAQNFRRVKSPTPVSLLDALAASFPAEQKEFLVACMDGGDILVNEKPCKARAMVTKGDKVLIVFGGPKRTYAASNRAEYWAELFQCWYDANRVHDHDHNDIQTRAQLMEYDKDAAALLAEVLGDQDWRFVSPRLRMGKEHLAGYTLVTGTAAKTLEHIDLAAQDYYDKYWKDYWKRLHEKHPGFKTLEPADGKKDSKELLK